MRAKTIIERRDAVLVASNALVNAKRDAEDHAYMVELAVKANEHARLRLALANKRASALRLNAKQALADAHEAAERAEYELAMARAALSISEKAAERAEYALAMARAALSISDKDLMLSNDNQPLNYEITATELTIGGHKHTHNIWARFTCDDILRMFNNNLAVLDFWRDKRDELLDQCVALRSTYVNG